MKSSHKRVRKSFLLIALVIVVASGVFFFFKAVQSNNAQPGVKACKDENGLTMCVSSSKSRLSSSDEVELVTTITNKTNKDVSHTFSCTYTNPSIIVNNKDLSEGIVCGSAFTPKVIPAHKTETFTYSLAASKMKTGGNTVKAVWGVYESGLAIIQKT